MKHMLLILCLLNFLLVTLSADMQTVQRQRAIVRSGAGLFYPVIAELAQGTQMDVHNTINGWLEIALQDSMGFVSAKVTKAQQNSDNPFLKMASGGDVRLSRHGMSAGVKGFASRFTKAFGGDVSFHEIYASYQLNPSVYRRFERNMPPATPSIPLPVISVQDYFSFSEAGMGIAIASRIAQLGLLQNPDVQDYVNCVGTRVASMSQGYDVGFRFFVLDVDAANAYACPGGVVFITRGMMQSLNSEAELALILGHEIAHVVLRHGMQEMEKRKHHIKSDDAFAQMDEEFEKMGEPMDAEYKAVEEEMDAMALEIYDTIYQGRMDAYEVEADRFGALYAARAGYNARLLNGLLHRLLVSSPGSTNEHYTPSQIQTRIDALQLSSVAAPRGSINEQQRYQHYKALL